MKRILILLNACFLILIFSTFVIGSEQLSYSDVCSKYNLSSLQSCPEGVNPVPVSSPEQLDQILSDLYSTPYETVFYYSYEPSTVTKPDENYTNVTGTKRLHASKRIGALTTFHLWADVDIWSQGSFYQITGCDEWVGLTGVSLGVELSGEHTSHSISGQRVTIRGDGTIDVYLLVDGLVKLASYSTSLSISYGRR